MTDMPPKSTPTSTQAVKPKVKIKTANLMEALRSTSTVTRSGRVERAVGTIIRATADLSVGEACYLKTPEGSSIPAEVIGVDGEEVLIAPLQDMRGLSTHSWVEGTGSAFRVPVGPELLGCVLDGLGRPLAATPNNVDLSKLPTYPVNAPPPNPMTRPVIKDPISLGVRSIDGLLTCGRGQRVGVFAAAGGGKSTLLSMIVKNAEADAIVIALIGERGREVREFIEDQLGEEGMSRSVVVVATSDTAALEQMKAAFTATAIAEYYRDQGMNVLLLMDSLTRFARAQRQVGLAAGEPPTRRGFPPSVFEQLPRLLERTGNNEHGSITAIYTVLVEGDDMTEPVADESRSLLDGHIILSRELASKGHYPAVDILASVSRVMTAITDKPHQKAASDLRELLSKYNDIELLVNIGEYQKGADELADKALARIKDINGFLRQRTDEFTPLGETIEKLKRAVK